MSVHQEHGGNGSSGTFVPWSDLAIGKAVVAGPAGGVDIEAELAAFEAQERDRLGLGAKEQWVEPIFDDPSTADKETTTLLLSGLTMAQDYFVGGALAGLGYAIVNLDCPNTEALRYGKEFGNRGQCNPTYFTVGNLVMYLTDLRDNKGMSTQEIIDKHVFLTAGSCGPCRFGMYVTEYRKALRDAGFEGFRVLLFQMNGGIKQASGEKKGLSFDPKFFLSIGKALLTGDAINVLAYRTRPYEIEEGATDRALAAAKEEIHAALKNRKSLAAALLRARRHFSRVKVDRTRVKPKVGIIGEFWAMTTEGDGNYHMQAFLQEEGAEVDIQLVTGWILFMVWEHLRDTKHRMTLRHDDDARKGLDGVDVRKKLLGVWAADKALRLWFQGLAKTLGVHGYHLPNIQDLADITQHFYNHDLRGGEAYLEVGKVIMNVVKSKVNMTLSIKPFGCMPSSGVSDGVQSCITELYPDAVFLPVETTGDGAVNVHSRVQMMLFKARQAAHREVDRVLDDYGMTMEDVRRTLDRLPLLEHPLFRAPHHHACTAADTVELVGSLRHPVKGLKRAWAHWRKKPVYKTPKFMVRAAGEEAAGARAADAA